MMLTHMRDRITVMGALIAFGAWTTAVLTPTLAVADRAITQWVQRYASPTLDVAFSVITAVGNADLTVPLATLLGLVLIRRGQPALALALWAGFIGGSAIEWATKHWLPHPGVPLALQRPHLIVFPQRLHTPYAYMSGHAFRTVLLGTVGSWMGTGRKSTAAWLGYVLGAVVFLIAIALVYLGDHWASEVVGGALLAAVCIAVLRAQPGWSASATGTQKKTQSA